MREHRDGFMLAPPVNRDERVKRIEIMGQRIDGYIKFMCEVAGMSGSSGEAKELGIAFFYEQLVVLENQLRLIHDNFRLQ